MGEIISSDLIWKICLGSYNLLFIIFLFFIVFVSGVQNNLGELITLRVSKCLILTIYFLIWSFSSENIFILDYFFCSVSKCTQLTLSYLITTHSHRLKLLLKCYPIIYSELITKNSNLPLLFLSLTF